jgi:hypothetical protein
MCVYRVGKCGPNPPGPHAPLHSPLFSARLSCFRHALQSSYLGTANRTSVYLINWYIIYESPLHASIRVRVHTHIVLQSAYFPAAGSFHVNPFPPGYCRIIRNSTTSPLFVFFSFSSHLPIKGFFQDDQSYSIYPHGSAVFFFGKCC